MRILDRYVLRNFLEPFLLCFFGFIAIWLVFDLSGNVQDFIEGKTPLKVVAGFYLTQLPDVVLFSLPIGLLLALLFSLSRMSRHNEIISMLTAGRSLYRLIVPLVVVAIGCTAVCFWLNAERAPHAAAIKKKMLEEITRGNKKADDEPLLEGHVYRDRLHNRTWFVRKMVPKPDDTDVEQSALTGVHVIQQDPTGVITFKWYASRGKYDHVQKLWKLYRGMTVEFDKEGNIVRTEAFPKGWREVRDWPETPRRIAAAQFQAQDLSISELSEYLQYNGDFPAAQLAPFRMNLADRWSFPWSCVVVVFIAAPLGIVYNRRGVLAGVAAALVLFFGFTLLRYLLLALGKGGRIDPLLAAWGPNGFFLLVGLLLLYYRATNKDLPTLAFWR